jgi:3-hydroxymyristoyl/3-hydroxydecanoyl-(acyl carrier protein) dehydratase
MLTKEEIKKIIPYQEPFLFVDKVEEITENSIFGFYQTSANDYYFKGHFVDFKIMPGVLVIEALAQLSTILLRKKIKENQNYHFLAYDVKNVQFLRPIFPGDKIKLIAQVLAIYPLNSKKIARVKGQALVGEDLKCEARFSVVIISKEEFRKKYKKDFAEVRTLENQ